MFSLNKIYLYKQIQQEHTTPFFMGHSNTDTEYPVQEGHSVFVLLSQS